MKSTPEQLRKQEYGGARRYLRKMVEEMLDGVDRDAVCDRLGISRTTFDDKVRHGRFRADELALLAACCGRTLTAVLEDGNQILAGPKVGEGDKAARVLMTMDADSAWLSYSKTGSKTGWRLGAERRGKSAGVPLGRLGLSGADLAAKNVSKMLD